MSLDTDNDFETQNPVLSAALDGKPNPYTGETVTREEIDEESENEDEQDMLDSLGAGTHD